MILQGTNHVIAFMHTYHARTRHDEVLASHWEYRQKLGRYLDSPIQQVVQRTSASPPFNLPTLAFGFESWLRMSMSMRMRMRMSACYTTSPSHHIPVQSNSILSSKSIVPHLPPFLPYQPQIQTSHPQPFLKIAEPSHPDHPSCATDHLATSPPFLSSLATPTQVPHRNLLSLGGCKRKGHMAHFFPLPTCTSRFHSRPDPGDQITHSES